MEIKELTEKRDALNGSLAKIFEEAKTEKGEYNFRQVKSLKEVQDLEGYAKSNRVAEIVRQKNDELNDTAKQLEELQKAQKIGEDFEKAGREPANLPAHPTGKKSEPESIGKQVTQSQVYKNWLQGSRDGQIEIKDFGLKELKTLFETGAGWAPESTRIPGFVDAVARPIQVMDIIPSAQTGDSSIVYMEETTRTHSAAEKAEGVAAPESTFAMTEKSSAVREIKDSIPVTLVQLEDVAQVESYLDSRLRFGLRQRLDSQVLVGDGNAPNLEGLNNVTGIQTQAKGTDPVPDAIFKAGTKLRVTGRVQPTHLIMHPNDWEPIRLLRTADGVYIWGNPSEAGPERIWGWPVIQSDAQTENTAILGSFQSPWLSLFERRGVTITRGTVGTQFTEGKETLLATMRVAFVPFRPAAFATITGI